MWADVPVNALDYLSTLSSVPHYRLPMFFSYLVLCSSSDSSPPSKVVITHLGSRLLFFSAFLTSTWMYHSHDFRLIRLHWHSHFPFFLDTKLWSHLGLFSPYLSSSLDSYVILNCWNRNVTGFLSQYFLCQKHDMYDALDTWKVEGSKGLKMKKKGGGGWKILLATKPCIVIYPDGLGCRSNSVQPEEWNTAQKDYLIESWNEEILEIM